MAVLGLRCCAGFLQLPWAGLLSTWGARASPQGGSSCCGAGAPGCTGSVALRPVGSSWTRDWTCVPCISRWVLNHWTTRESFIIYYAYFEVSLLFFCVLKWKVRFMIRNHSFLKCEHLLLSPAFWTLLHWHPTGYCTFTFIQFRIFFQFSLSSSLCSELLRSVLFNSQRVEDFPDSFLVIDFNLNPNKVRRQVMSGSNSFKSAKLFNNQE